MNNIENVEYSDYFQAQQWRVDFDYKHHKYCIYIMDGLSYLYMWNNTTGWRAIKTIDHLVNLNEATKIIDLKVFL